MDNCSFICCCFFREWKHHTLYSNVFLLGLIKFFFFFFFFFFINCEGMLTLYCSLFLPYLTYCCEIWGNTYATNVNCIYVILKKVVRIIHHEKRLAHTNCLFKQMHSLKFQVWLNTELPSLCLNYITVNCLHYYNPDFSEARIFTTLVAGTHLL